MIKCPRVSLCDLRRGLKKKPSQHLIIVSCFLLVVVFNSSLRNRVFRSILPRPWTHLSTWEILKVMYNAESGRDMAMLLPCTMSNSKRMAPPLLINSNKVGSRRKDYQQWVISSNYLQDLPSDTKKLHSHFRPSMTLNDKARLVTLWGVMEDALKRKNVTYFMSGGSLLGVIRHHGMIPWDDDIDVSVFEGDVRRLYDALSCLPGYVLRVQDNYRYKFFHSESHAISIDHPPETMHVPAVTGTRRTGLNAFEASRNVVVRFPFIDIFIVRNLGQITFALNVDEGRRSAHPTELILPLKEAAFEETLVQIPRNSRKVLEREFQVTKCESPKFQHRMNKPYASHVTVDCDDLVYMFPQD